MRKEKNGGYVLVVAVPGILLMDNDKIEHHLKYLKYEYEGIILIGVMQDLGHQIYVHEAVLQAIWQTASAKLNCSYTAPPCLCALLMSASERI